VTVPTMDPVVVSVFVNADAERAFDAFTAEMTSWWPLTEISISKPDRVVVEARKGGEIYEVNAGVNHHWAWITAWEPPNRIAVEWKVDEDASASTAWEATFMPEAEGTRLTLVHTGWEALGDGAAGARSSYDGGWVGVLERYVTYLNG
jgi:uncharacterized protein YndB with AHSA1/START domain